MATKSKTSTRIPTDEACFELLSRTANKTNLTVHVLANMCVEAFIGSLENYGVTAPVTEAKAITGSKGTKQVHLTKKTHERLNDVGVYLGASLESMVRDSILGQRFNFQRMQPVNARGMASVRMTLFHLEQGGNKQAQA